MAKANTRAISFVKRCRKAVYATGTIARRFGSLCGRYAIYELTSADPPLRPGGRPRKHVRYLLAFVLERGEQPLCECMNRATAEHNADAHANGQPLRFVDRDLIDKRKRRKVRALVREVKS